MNPVVGSVVANPVTGSVTGSVITARNVITREIKLGDQREIACSFTRTHSLRAGDQDEIANLPRQKRTHIRHDGHGSAIYAKRASPITISREGAPGVGHINVTLATRIEHERHRQADMRAHHDAPRASKALELGPWRPRFTLTTWMFDRKETAMEVFAEEMRERKASGKFDSQALLASIEAVESSDEDDGAGESSALSDDDE